MCAVLSCMQYKNDVKFLILVDLFRYLYCIITDTCIQSYTVKNDEYTQPYYNLKTVLYHWIKTGFRRAYMSVVQLLIRTYTVLRISYKPMPYKRAYLCDILATYLVLY